MTKLLPHRTHPPSQPKDLGANEDSTTMYQVANDNIVAFRTLYTRFRNPLVHSCNEVLNDPSLSERLADEILLSVFRQRKSFTPDRHFTTWIASLILSAGKNLIDSTVAKKVQDHFLENFGLDSQTTPSFFDDSHFWKRFRAEFPGPHYWWLHLLAPRFFIPFALIVSFLAILWLGFFIRSEHSIQRDQITNRRH